MNLNATLIFQSVAFAIFVWITMKYVFPPIMKAMRERQARIADGLAAADRGEKALQDASVKSDAALKEARQHAQDILAAANKQAAQAIEEAKGQAKTEAERIVIAAREETQRELNQARETLRKQVGELAVVGAAQILKREIDTKAHADVLKDLAGKI